MTTSQDAPPVLDSALLRATLRQELRAAWLHIRDSHAPDGLYGFGVYTTPSASYLNVTAFSERGLDEVVAAYVREYGEGGRSAKVRQAALKRGGRPDDPGLLRRSLRWSPCDSPLHAVGAELLARSDKVIQAADFEGRWADDDDLDDDEFDEACETPDPDVQEVFRIVVEELQRLDREGLFGTGTERQGFVLSVWQGDQSNLSRHAFAKMLNPPETAARFGREMNDQVLAHTLAFHGEKALPELDVFE